MPQGKDIEKKFKQQTIDGAWQIQNKHDNDKKHAMSDKAESARNKNVENKHQGRRALRDWEKADAERNNNNNESKMTMKITVNESQLHRIIKEATKKVLKEIDNRDKYALGYKNFKGNKGTFLDVDTINGKTVGSISKHDNGERSSEGYKLRCRSPKVAARKAKKYGIDLQK